MSPKGPSAWFAVWFLGAAEAARPRVLPVMAVRVGGAVTLTNLMSYIAVRLFLCHRLAFRYALMVTRELSCLWRRQSSDGAL
mmetsp:Transcript_9312/g.28195  ORF Transcript_9312/g.28195 Transcript_9312/m.28195 type:complete len:82 (-) Transcript_9312:1029-1274(-)